MTEEIQAYPLHHPVDSGSLRVESSVLQKCLCSVTARSRAGVAKAPLPRASITSLFLPTVAHSPPLARLPFGPPLWLFTRDTALVAIQHTPPHLLPTAAGSTVSRLEARRELRCWWSQGHRLLNRLDQPFFFFLGGGGEGVWERIYTCCANYESIFIVPIFFPWEIRIFREESWLRSRCLIY